MKLRFLIITVFTIAISSSAFAQMKSRAYNNGAAIEEVIREAYINGVYNTGYMLSVTQGFSPDFTAIVFEDKDQSRLETIEDWIKKTEQNKASGNLPLKGDQEVTFDIVKLEISNNVANARVQFMVGGKVQHTDFIGLYKFSTGWKLVNMMYEEGQEEK